MTIGAEEAVAVTVMAGGQVITPRSAPDHDNRFLDSLGFISAPRGTLASVSHRPLEMSVKGRLDLETAFLIA
jgi:hypothetical protein